MRVVNAARHAASRVFFATDKHARESVVVVLKAVYSIPGNGRVPRPLLPPQPVALTDVFSGDPGLSAPLYESDLVPFKPACDVLFTASAHSPDGQPCTRLDVAASVGAMHKTLRVWGDRVWEKDLMILRASRPRPFTSMPLHFGRAFGGYHRIVSGEPVFGADTPPESVRHDAFLPNPFGLGYAADSAVQVHGLPMPNLELPGSPTRHPRSGTAVALSPLPRTVPERVCYAGTYDEHWKNTVAPFLPADFDERFYQCAPCDQRIPYPVGGEVVHLVNMMPGRPEVCFVLPRLDVLPVRVLHRDYRVSEPVAHVDTLHFEPDEGRFSVVWRARVPLPLRGHRDVRAVVMGEVCARWWAGVRAGGAGCSGCGAVGVHAPIRNGVRAAASPEYCLDCPETPAMDPFDTIPPIVVSADPEAAPEDAAPKQGAPEDATPKQGASKKVAPTDAAAPHTSDMEAQS